MISHFAEKNSDKNKIHGKDRPWMEQKLGLEKYWSLADISDIWHFEMLYTGVNDKQVIVHPSQDYGPASNPFNS